MRKGLGLAAALALSVTVLGLPAAARGGSSSQNASANPAAACSTATARQLVEQHDLNIFILDNPVRQVLCGSFTGPGSQAMAITIGAPTCWGIQLWAVLRDVGGAWELALRQTAYLIPPLVAVGNQIRETTAVSRPGDSRCFPSGGTRSRLWHWNGSRLVAGPWKQVAPADKLRMGHFKTPSANIVCVYSVGTGSEARNSGVLCGIKTGLKPKPPYTAECKSARLDHNADRIGLPATGRAKAAACSGDAGPFIGESSARVLAYGKTWSGGGVRCTSAVTGLTCRNKSGHGFFLSRERWRTF
jgi:hypothetical protein